MAAEWTPERLQAVHEEWHSRLALGAWVTGIAFVPAKDLNPDHEAEVVINDEHRMARISVQDPKEHGTDFFDQPWDVERAVVHELLHLHEFPIEQAMKEALKHCAPAVKEAVWNQYDMAREQMINTLARILVNLKRSADRAPMETERGT